MILLQFVDELEQFSLPDKKKKEIELNAEVIKYTITQEADIYEEAVQGENSTVLGKTVTVWNYDMGYGMSSKTYKDIESGIILKYETVMSGFTMTSTVTSIDTTVTSFGDVELPQ